MSDLVKALREINNRLTAGIQTDTYGMVQEINRAANELESLQSQLTEANNENRELLESINGIGGFRARQNSDRSAISREKKHVERLSAEVEELQNQIINARAVLTEWAIHNPPQTLKRVNK